MDYKAKYNEALERAKRWADGTLQPDRTTPQGVCEAIFPELAESEDERIRKMCITAVNIAASADGGLLHHEAKQCLDWLELKQKENSKSADSIPSYCTSDAKCEDRWYKVGDSLPDEDEKIRKKAIEYINAFVPYDDKDEIIAWLEKQQEPEYASASTIMIPSCWEEKNEQKPEPDIEYIRKDALLEWLQEARAVPHEGALIRDRAFQEVINHINEM